LAVSSVPAAAQQPVSDFDYQFRLLLHSQAPLAGDRFGLAGWWVLPDATVQNNHWRSLFVAGWLDRQPRRWIELMGGALVHEGGRVEPVVNFRMNERGWPRAALIADLQYFPRADRFYWWLGMDTPFSLRALRLRFGVESENVTFANRKDSFGIGPRLVVAVPAVRSASIVTAYQFRNDRDFLRTYLLVNF
jgi:hypothetical protein